MAHENTRIDHGAGVERPSSTQSELSNAGVCADDGWVASGGTEAPRVGSRRTPVRRAIIALVVLAGAVALGASGYAIAAGAVGTSGSGSGSVGSSSGSSSSGANPSSGAPGHFVGPRRRLGLGPRFGPGGFGPGATISAIGPSSLTLSAPGNRTVTVDTDGSTVYKAAGGTVDRSFLATGEQVIVRPQRLTGSGKTSPGSSSSGSSSGSTSSGSSSDSSTGSAPRVIMASEVNVVGPSIAGTVHSVSGDTVVIVDAQGFWRTMKTSSKTLYFQDASSAKASVLTVGVHMVAVGTIAGDHTTLDALAIDAWSAPANGGPAPDANGPWMGPGPGGPGVSGGGRP